MSLSTSVANALGKKKTLNDVVGQKQALAIINKYATDVMDSLEIAEKQFDANNYGMAKLHLKTAIDFMDIILCFSDTGEEDGQEGC